MSQHRNRVDVEVQVKGNALGDMEQLAAGVQRWAQSVRQLEAAYRQASQAAQLYPSALAKLRLEVQEARDGYVEGMGRMAEETLNFADVLNRAKLYAEDVGFSLGKFWEGVNTQVFSKFDDQAKLAKEAGAKSFDALQKSLDDGMTNIFAAVFDSHTGKLRESWQKFTHNIENTFYQSLGRMASALVQENLLKPLYDLGKEAAGGLLSAAASGLKALFLAEGGLVTKPTVAVLEPLPLAA